ncbi:cobalamin-binding protein [Noviherbaspirillum sp. L7-7A]|nr:cobalamin-binding protein [Noviherbaspirillum sp. L7-7A]MBV0882059.1 cobalamin-binding protein [Noviherbaspirillum sp. L7-7A]
MRKLTRLALATLCLHGLQAAAAVTVQDDEGNKVTLDKPAQRVISLAPHVTELLFAAGGGRKVVGVVDYSDYPPEAKALPRVGSHRQIDLERLIALKPDLLVVWLHGGAARQLEPLRRLGIPVYVSEPHRIAEIGPTLRRLGQLLGTEAEAGRGADAFERRLATIETSYASRPPVKVFYQVWDRPLYTLNGSHTASDAIRLCGGQNIFAALPVTAPTVTVEAVLKENPEVIVSGNRPDKDSAGLEAWKQYPSLLAARRDNLVTIDADQLVRPGPRILDGTAALCERLDEARGKRSRQP